ncbi:DUF2207 domain-containing protein [Candidatus Saccharibacteria bacterium]|nr:DUF2207 domain-containing protein [Candidatus Saccharibacteria bacterium]
MRLKHFLWGMVIVLALVPINNVFASAQDFYFEDFIADYYLTKLEDGTSNLHVKEVLTAVFPETSQNHGITRTIPYTNQGGVNRTVANEAALNLTVLRNGKSENVNKIVDDDGYYTIYIGSASEYVHGEQVYTLEYDYADVITEFAADGENVSGKENVEKAFQELYWDTNGTGWKQEFGKVSARLHVSADMYKNMFDDAWCYVGQYGAKGEDRCVIMPTSDGFEFEAVKLGVGENLTFVTEFEPDTFKVVIKKDYTLVVILVVEIMLAAIIVIWRILKWKSEAKPKYDMYKKIFVVPQYQPPKDKNVCVAEGGQVYIKKTKSSYVATLLELAVSKKVTIKKIEGEKYDWAVILNVEPEKLTGSQKQMMNILSGDGKFKKDDEIAIQKHIETSYLSDCAKKYEEGAEDVLKKNGYFIKEEKEKNKFKWLSVILLVFVMWGVIFGIETIENFVEKYVANANGVLVGGGLIPLLIPVIFMITVIIISKIEQQRRKYAKYTEEGLKLVRFLEGLELYIKMAEADRLKFLQSVEGADMSNAGIVKLYEKLLPWASLFGEEKSWAKELEKYYDFEGVNEVISSDVLNGIIASNMVRDINNTIMKSTSYANAGGGGSSFSSGGGGGGFSGGGGGGGGGGGW